MGRSDRNRKVILATENVDSLPFLSDAGAANDADVAQQLAALERGEQAAPSDSRVPIDRGQYVVCRATDSMGTMTLRGEPIAIVDSLRLADALTRHCVPVDIDHTPPKVLLTETKAKKVKQIIA